MSDKNNQNEIWPLRHIPSDITSVGGNPALERRAENIQLLAAIGILTLSGTLYVNGQIEFPLLEAMSEVSYVRDIFRYFVYLTILFVASKVVTITIYPIIESSFLLWIHERFEPFLFVFSPLLLTVASILAIVFGQFNTDIIIISISILGAAIPAYFISKRMAIKKKEKREKIKRSSIVTDILQILTFGDFTRKNPIMTNILLEHYFPESAEEAQEMINELIVDSTFPVENDGEYIWVSNVDEARRIIYNVRDEVYGG